MATLREFLDEVEFDWDTGRIIVHETDDGTPGWDRAVGAREVDADDPVLDRTFSDGYGGPQCPRYIAEDAAAIYFPYQYDGATGPVKVLKDIGAYLDWENNGTPYPGGG